MRKGTLTIVDSDKSYLWEEDAEDVQVVELTPAIERKLAKNGYHWQELDHGIRLLVGPGGYCRTVKGALDEIYRRGKR